MKNVVNKTVLITGGAGFIGSHVVDQFVDHGWKVIVVDNYTAINSGYRNKQARYMDVDILTDAFEKIWSENAVDVCIHLAAQVSVAVSVKDPYIDAKINILGSIRVIELCKKYKVGKLIVASSAAVYGMPQYLPIDETHPTNPLSAYGVSKLAMEKYLCISGVPYVILRFANVYGERQTAEGEAGVVAIFNKNIRQGLDIIIDGDGRQTRDFVYVRDVAKFVYEISNSDVICETINVGTNRQTSIIDLFYILAGIYSYKKEPCYVKKRVGDIKDSLLDNQKCLSFVPSFKFSSLQEGLKNMIMYDSINYR